MNHSACIFGIGLAFAVLTTLAAPEKPKFNPDEALGFLETLTSIQDGKPDIYLLAKLFKARYAPGAGDDFVKTVETFVSSGLHAAGRIDLYVKSVRPECKNMDADELERQVAHECGNCQGGKIEKQCERCGGRGRCRACEGRGSFMHKLEALRPIDVRWEQIKCGVCLGSGRCSSCNGQGRISLDCPNCKGRGHIYDTDEALKVYYVNALALIKGLCDIGDQTDMPDLLKRDFSKARENAEKKFPVLRQAREKETAEARAEQERKEKEEQERREKEEQAERERKEKEEQAERERKEKEEQERKEQVKKERMAKERHEHIAKERELRAKGLVSDVTIECHLGLDGEYVTQFCMLCFDSSIEDMFNDAVEAKRISKIREEEYRDAEYRYNLIRNGGVDANKMSEMTAAWSKCTDALNKKTDSACAFLEKNRNLEEHVGLILKEYKDKLKSLGSTESADSHCGTVRISDTLIGTQTFKDVPRGLKYHIIAFVKVGSHHVIWMKPVVISDRNQQIILTNDQHCLITKFD